VADDDWDEPDWLDLSVRFVATWQAQFTESTFTEAC